MELLIFSLAESNNGYGTNLLVEEKAFEKRRDSPLHELERLDAKLQKHQNLVPNPMVRIVFNNSSRRQSLTLGKG